MSQSTERRKHVRRAVFIPCRLEGSAAVMHLTDLSPGGCFVETSHEVAVGSGITLRATISGSDISLPGRVVRVQPGHGFGVAIDAAALNDEARQRLEGRLRACPRCQSTDTICTKAGRTNTFHCYNCKNIFEVSQHRQPAAPGAVDP
jgi:Tfp pilus assembly protein PilZ